VTIPTHSFSTSTRQTGSAIPWVLLWVVGTAALAYFCLIRHVPTLELATEGRISQALSAASATGVVATVKGYTATLSGTAQDDSQKQAFLALASDTPGVRNVIDQVNVSSAAVATANNDTPIVGKPIKLASDTPSSSDTESDTTETAASDDNQLTNTATDAATDTLTTAAITAETTTEVTEAESSDVVDTKSDTAEASDAPKATEVENTDDTSITAADNASTTEEASEEPVVSEPAVVATIDPSLKLEVDDGTLMLDGQVANTDDLNLLIDQAKSSLSVDFVSNSTEAKDDTKPATWLEPITALVPAMAPLRTPGINIEKDQITLSGLAPDQESHDSVITRALQLLGNYSLIERIEIAKPEPASIETLNESIDETNRYRGRSGDRSASDGHN